MNGAELLALERDWGLPPANWNTVPQYMPPLRQPLDYKEDWPDPVTKGGATTITGGGTGLHAFSMVDTTTGVTNKIRVHYGTVNGVAPTGMSPGDDPIYELTVTTDGYLYLVITTDADGVVNSRTIGDYATVQVDDPGSYTYYQQIGSYAVSGAPGTPINLGQAVGGSQWVEICGGGGGDAAWGLI